MNLQVLGVQASGEVGSCLRGSAPMSLLCRVLREHCLTAAFWCAGVANTAWWYPMGGKWDRMAVSQPAQNRGRGVYLPDLEMPMPVSKSSAVVHR